MIQKRAKLVFHPKKYFILAVKMMQQRMCYLFQNTSFFMQGQMDINQKSRWHRDDFSRSTGGYYPKNDDKSRQICNLESWDNTRRDMLVLLLRTIAEKNIEGDLAELGVYRREYGKADSSLYA